MQRQNLPETEWEGTFQGAHISPLLEYWPDPWRGSFFLLAFLFALIFTFSIEARHGSMVWSWGWQHWMDLWVFSFAKAPLICGVEVEWGQTYFCFCQFWKLPGHLESMRSLCLLIDYPHGYWLSAITCLLGVMYCAEYFVYTISFKVDRIIWYILQVCNLRFREKR